QLTLNTIVQGAWALLLSRYGGGDDVVFGATVSGRPAELDGVESMVGLFINTVPVRTTVSPNSQLGSWLGQLQAEQLEARQSDHTSLVQIHAWSDVPRNQPLFETLLAFENFPAGMGRHATAQDAPAYRVFTRTNYPLSLAVLPADEWTLKLV